MATGKPLARLWKNHLQRRRRSITIQPILIIAVLAGLIVPALAQTQGGAGNAPDQGIGRTEDGGHMGHEDRARSAR
jgi:hypothetical protein